MKRARVALMVLVAAVLATGTIFERFRGAEWVAAHFYTAWWFVALMTLVAVGAVLAIVQGRMWKRPPALLIHAAVPVILLGGALTTWVGHHGSMELKPGEPTAMFDIDGREAQLPFSVTLESFEVVPYPGTHTPMDFVSHVLVEGEPYDISMNNILRHRGYRFYQEDYDGEGGSTLSVAHDPWGIGVTYCGYAMLILGLIGLMGAKDGPFRRLLRGIAVVVLLLASTSVATAQPKTLSRADADQMGRMYVMYKGRICPLQTMAKDFTTKLTGKATYKGLTPEQVLAGWMFYYDQWQDEPMVKLKGEAASIAGGRRVSMRQLAFLDTMTLSPSTDKNLRAASEKRNLVGMLSSGRLLKLFPVEGSWYGQNDELPLGIGDGDYMFIRLWQSYCQELVAKGDSEGLTRVFDKTRTYQTKHSTSCPVGAQLWAERLYNDLTTGRWLAMLSITLGLICFAAALFLRGRAGMLLRWVATVAVALLTVFLMAIFILRWVTGGHAPMAGGFDSMNLMSIGIGIVALLMVRRWPVASSIGLLTMGFCQLVAMMSGSNPPVTNLMPVLNSPLLTLHVAVIMCSYALFFFVMMGGVAGLVSGSERYRRMNLMLLYPAVLLLAMGIIIGAVWANISWGNYWSWDPKEVWALITLIVYTLPLHHSLLQKQKTFYLYCMMAFLSVAVTYFGVNMLLGGMHSYS